MNEIVVHEQPRTALQIREQVNLIQEVMRSVMKANVHYGKIPYTDKPTLYKAGSEVLLSTFRIAVEPEVEDLSDGDEIRYRVHAKGIAQPSSILVGIGVGECSSGEEKYKWRAAVCDEEWEDTLESRRRIKYGKRKGGQGHYTVKQVRTEPADVANTILKMAKKRAQIDLTLTSTAASDIFNQDLEDLPEELQEAVTEGEPRPEAVSQPQRKSSGNGKPISEGQQKVLRATLEKAGVTETEFNQAWSLEGLEKLPAASINDALKWISEHASA